MKVFLILILSIIAYIQAYPQAPTNFNLNPPPQAPQPKFNFNPPPQVPQPKFNFNPPAPDPNNKRFEITHLQGGGSSHQGFDVSGGAKARFWESKNQQHQIHGTGSYSQHLGGPFGNSRPNVGAGISYTHHFG